MAPLLRNFLAMNWLLLAVTLGLSIFGLAAIYSATYMRADPAYANAMSRQALWLGIGIVLFFCVALVDYRWLRWGAIPLYLTGIGLLVFTRFKGATVFGARSWLDLGFFSIQTSQVAVFATIVTLAVCLSTFPRLHPFLKVLMCGAVMAAPMLLILDQPDLGSAIVLVPVFLCMLFVAGLPLRYLTSMVLLGVGALPLVAHLALKEYQWKRIMTFLDPDIDPLGAGWTINQSLIAIGSGGWDGKGWKAPNTLTEMGFLPSTIVHNDFVFSVIGETFGFVGGALLVAAFGFLLLNILNVAFHAEHQDKLGMLFVAGVGAQIFTHTFMNIGMTISVTPITGLPLPFVSYGGSFLVMMLVSMGLIQSVWIHRKREE